MLTNVNVGSSLRERQVCECVAVRRPGRVETAETRNDHRLFVFWFGFTLSTRGLKAVFAITRRSECISKNAFGLVQALDKQGQGAQLPQKQQRFYSLEDFCVA